MKIAVLVFFILTYVLIIALSKYKVLTTGIIAAVVTALILIGGITDFTGVVYSIKYDVIFMLTGIMLTVGIFAKSNMPNKIADKLMSKLPNTLIAIVGLAVISGVISAFVDNVATVLMLAPIGLAIAKKTGVSPIPVLIAISVSSNLQGAATLVGDTTSIMLADALNMSFFDFFFYQGRFSIFWMVELGAFVTIPVLMLLCRKENKKLQYVSEEVKVTSIFPTVILLLNLTLLVIASFLNIEINFLGSSITNGVICLLCGVISLLYYTFAVKTEFKSNLKDALDYETVLFLIFLFLIIGAVSSVGIISDISQMIKSVGSSNVLLLYTVIVFGSVILSAFIDNIPYVATMLPVIAGISEGLGSVSVALYFGLLIGATLGGNLTPFGASANVVAIGTLKKEGYTVKNSDFFKIGLPFTLVAVLSGYGLCWLIWGI